MTARTEPLRIYVAASSKELARVDRALAMIDSLGKDRAVVTYRWIDDMRATIASGRSEADLSRAEAEFAAMKCLHGVWDSDVSWFLYPRTPTCGFWCEIGACATARHANAPVVRDFLPMMLVSYDSETDFERPQVPKIWRYLSDLDCASDEEAFRYIQQRAAQRAAGREGGHDGTGL